MPDSDKRNVSVTCSCIKGETKARMRARIGPIFLIVLLPSLAVSSALTVSAVTIPAPVVATGEHRADSPAQSATWELDRFSVSYFYYGKPSTNEVRDAALRSFVFGDSYSVTGGNTYRGNGTLSVNVPNRIDSGGTYSVDARAAGDIGVTGAVQADGELAYLEVDALCWGDSQEPRKREEKRILPGMSSVSFSAALAPLNLTAPEITGPTTPASHNCEFHATLHVGFVVEWKVWVQAQYKPKTATEPGLTLEANPSRLPPSGVSPSESTLTATVRDAAGRPIAGERVDFTLQPADMGRLQAARGTTDAAGLARVRYTAPTLAEMRGRKSVTVRARVTGRQLERALNLELESYRLSATITPDQLPIQEPPGSAKLRLVAERFDGRPAAGDVIQLRLDPPDMGSLLGDALVGDRVTTDAQGVAEVFYEAPSVEAMHNRDLVTVFATNLSHGGEASAAVRFVGLRVTGAQPPEGVRDVDLKPGGGAVIQLDRAVDPASVNAATVKVQTLWHGDLAAQGQVVGSTIQVRITQDPIPDVGLVVTVRLVGGANGVKSVDGRALAGDFTLRFMTMPLLKPKIVVSQVVDDPHDPTYGVVSVSPKPFLLRVTGGLSSDSELTSELASVSLTTPTDGQETKEHTFYPGDWPPRVPDAAVRLGNSANFVVDSSTRAGAFAVTAKARAFFASDDKAVAANPVTVNLNRWRNPRVALGLGVLLVPIQSDHLPGYEWNVSRNQLNRWASLLGVDRRATCRYVDVGAHGVLRGHICNDPDQCDFARRPWTVFNHWVRHIGRAGYATPWSYIFAVVPQGWFAAKFADHPDVVARPELYHNMVNNGIWTDAVITRDVARQSPSMSPMIQADISDAAFVHALGDAIGRPHSTAKRDTLAGYDLEGDQAMVSNAEGWTGAFLSLMSEDVGYGREWTSRADYEAFLDRWTEKPCQGVPPCAPSGQMSHAGAEGQSNRTSAQPADPEPGRVPLIGVSGTIRQGATEVAKIEPLIWFDGTPTLTAGSVGDYAIVLRDAGGATLGTYGFTPAFGPIEGGRLAGFLVSVPRPMGGGQVATVAVTHGGTEIGVVRKSVTAPVVTITRPAAGQTFRGPVEATWSGLDADGDLLTYHVLFSGDGGGTWLPLRVDTKQTTTTLPGDELPNGRDARLRVVASDGFNSGQAELRFSLDGVPQVLAVVPEDGGSGVSPLTGVSIVVRDPLDPASLNAGTFTLRRSTGEIVPGAVTYDSQSGTVTLDPAAPLAQAHRYEARLSTGARTSDGRRLPADFVWHFTTRGHSILLPRVAQAGNTGPAVVPPAVTPRPGAATPRPTPRPGSTAMPAPTATPAGVIASSALTTGADAERTRQAFAAAEPIVLWVSIYNGTGAAITAQLELTVVGDNGFAPNELAWRGALQVPAGASRFRLERNVPRNMAAGAYRLLGTVNFGGRATTATADFFVAD